MRSPAVALDGVEKRFVGKSGTVHALDTLDLTVAPGEFVALVGPSGCGKSTLLNLVGGLLLPSQGTVVVNGHRVTGPPAEVGVMFQSPVLLDWRTARENVVLPLEVHGGRRAAREAAERANDLLRLVGLDGFTDRYPGELSGGMQQRVAICRMLIADPDVLLLDEPFGALDELTREHLNAELARIVGTTAKTTVLVTHNIPEAVFLSDRIVVMTPRPGRVAGIVDVALPRPRTLDQVTTEPFQLVARAVRALLDPPSSVAADRGGARTVVG